MFKAVSGPTREKASLDNSFTDLDTWAYVASISDDQIADDKHVLLILMGVGTSWSKTTNLKQALCLSGILTTRPLTSLTRQWQCKFSPKEIMYAVQILGWYSGIILKVLECALSLIFLLSTHPKQFVTGDEAQQADCSLVHFGNKASQELHCTCQ